jgi:hypothetical protein
MLDGGSVPHRFRVKEYEIGDAAGRDPAAVAQPELLRREPGHFVNGFCQRQHFLLSHVQAEDTRKSARPTWMRAMQFAIAGEHDLGLCNEPPYVVLAHRGNVDALERLVRIGPCARRPQVCNCPRWRGAERQQPAELRGLA